MKKLFALLLALVMILGLATTAFADGTISNSTDRNYHAYQIFTGTQAAGDPVLGNIVWGNGIDSANFLNALKTLSVNGATPFASCTTAADVAEVLGDTNDNSDIAKAFANLAVNHITGTPVNVPANAQDFALEEGYYLLVDVSENNATQNPALLQVTNGDLTITNKAPGTPEPGKSILEDGEKKTTTTANIGDSITFELTATLPASFENYESYMLAFVDTLSPGLTYNGDAQVYFNNQTVDSFTTTTTTNAGNTIITIKNQNILDDGIEAENLVNQAFTVIYTATLNENAVIGSAGNPNSVVLDYSNNPDDETDFKTTPPPPEVIVYTWEIPVFKYTGTEKTPLAGAGFTLYKGETPVNLVDDGNNIYKVCTLTGCTHTHVTEVFTDSTGKFQIEGLESGTYCLKETTTPPGYNTCDDVTVVIDKDGNLTQDGTATTEVGVLNNAGSTLPETGGMGTTLFYVFGGILMAAAVVLLVTKKRMANA